MKSSVILFLCFILISRTKAQQVSTENEIHRLVNVLIEKHYSPKSLDDSFSKKLYTTFLETMDDKHLFLLKGEVQALSIYQNRLDDELNKQELSFIKEYALVYRKGLTRTQKILETLRSKGIASNKEERYIPLQDTADYAQTEAELMLRWSRYLKLQTLVKEYQYTLDSVGTKPSLNEIYIKVIAKSLKKVSAAILENKNSFGKLYYEYAKCIPILFDPHSSYMSYNDFQDFESLLSKENYKFGITVQKNKIGSIEIVRVTPGSPAWKSGKINIGDVVTHLKWQNGERIELADMELHEVQEILGVSNNHYLEFTIQTSSGTVEIFSLKKEKANSEENMVKGFVLTGADQRKIGYIYLPSFYTLFESENMLGCANDVAKELVKLQQEKIDGLIFDLRNNGGGSLKEGLELSGLFVNEGALAIEKMKGRQPTSLKDWNRGVAYGGPMVVLVNGHSASASELMASTLQDFNRAVLVGVNTYGKATGQELFPIGKTGYVQTDSVKTGYVSVTTLKLYRVTGKSNQITGVTPDISLPDPFVNIYENESKELEALPKDTVTKKTYYQPLNPLPLLKLRELSKNRVEHNEQFKHIKEISLDYKTVFEISEQSVLLTKEAVKKICDDYRTSLKDIRKYYYPQSGMFKVKPTDADGTLNLLSEEDRMLSNYSIERIQSDLTLEESYQIINDLINNP